MELTGQQGDVMKESMKVARTVAWNVLPSDIKKKLYTYVKMTVISDSYSLPEGSTHGWSVLEVCAYFGHYITITNIPINNTIGITGEIDLNGSIRAPGGLESTETVLKSWC